MYAFSAAHKTLPLPTYARVTNLENGRSVVVRINDRGPFHQDRLIDLSYAAAIKLGIHLRGTGSVEVQALTAGDIGLAQAPPPASAAPAARPAAASTGKTWLQVASFGNKDNARRLADRLEQADLDRVRIERARVRGDRVWRVRIGPLAGQAVAEALAARIRALGLGQPTVIAE
jgi:rare lipoprotein A